MVKGHKKTVFYFPSKKGEGGKKSLSEKKSEFSPFFDHFLTIFDQFFFHKGGRGRGSCQIQKFLIRKTEVVKKGEGVGPQFFLLKVKKQFFLCLPNFHRQQKYQKYMSADV